MEIAKQILLPFFLSTQLWTIKSTIAIVSQDNHLILVRMKFNCMCHLSRISSEDTASEGKGEREKTVKLEYYAERWNAGGERAFTIRMGVALKCLTMCLCLGEIHFSCFSFFRCFAKIPFNLLFVGGLIFSIVETCGVRVYHCVCVCECLFWA